MQRKYCPKCDTTKSLDEFYKNASARDGHQTYCKVCWKKDCDARNKRDPAHRRAILLASYHHRKNLKPKKKHPVKPYDHKVKARRALQHEVRLGRIKRQPCERCRKPNADAHHDDYSKPLDVRWLCSLCHAAVHREQEEAADEHRVQPSAREGG
jgi:hypothetical protein